MFRLLSPIIEAIQPFLTPLCFVAAWLIVALFIRSFWLLAREAVDQSKKMHQIPCSSCQFFTNSHHLKCTLHPKLALSEAAIDCPDYRNSSLYSMSTD